MFRYDYPKLIAGVIMLFVIGYFWNTGLIQNWFSGTSIIPLEKEIRWNEDKGSFEVLTPKNSIAGLVLAVNRGLSSQALDYQVDHVRDAHIMAHSPSSEEMLYRNDNNGRCFEEGFKIEALRLPPFSRNAMVVAGKASKNNMSIKVSSKHGAVSDVIFTAPGEVAIYMALLFGVFLFLPQLWRIGVGSVGSYRIPIHGTVSDSSRRKISKDAFINNLHVHTDKFQISEKSEYIGSIGDMNMGDDIKIDAGGNVMFGKGHAVIKMNESIDASNGTDAMKEKLKELSAAVGSMLDVLKDDQSEEVTGDLKVFVDEATKETPRQRWYDISAEGLIKAAKTAGKIGEPVIKATESILKLLNV